MAKWEDYKKWVGDVIKSKKRYYYRGQMDCLNWKLQTTFHRLVERKGIKLSLPEYLDEIIPIVNYYISAWHNEVMNPQDPNELASLLSLLQHNGFPTPLLDWTLSPYIAAYFAFGEINDEKPQCDNVKIFIFDYIDWKEKFSQPLDLKDLTPFISIILPYARYNQRIINQQGAYTVTNVPDMAQHLNYNGTIKNKKFLYEYVFSVKEKPQVMRELNLMGINEMTLFPGIEGICKTMREAFFSKDEVGLTASELLQQFLSQFKPPEPKLNPFQVAIEAAARSKSKLGES